MKKLTSLLVGLLLAVPMFAADVQPGQKRKVGSENQKFLQEFTKHWKTAKDFTIAVAEKMPADSYDSKPNPAEMGFGQLMVHIGEASGYFLSGVSGTKVSMDKPASMEKDAVIQFLAKSFDTVSNLLSGLTEQQLNKTSNLEDQQMTGREGLMAALGHVIHHRGQAEVYLRVKDIKPPDYTF